MVLHRDPAMGVPRLQISIAILTFAMGLAGANPAMAQSTTYHLHKDASTTSGLFQLKTAGPDPGTFAIQSLNLKNLAAGEHIVKAFDTEIGVPGVSGVIPSNSTLTFTLWMKKTAASGAMYPRARVRLNTSTGTLLCQATGTTALTTTLSPPAPYEISCTTGPAITVSASDRFYVWVGVNVTTVPTTNNRAELHVEGTLNGNYDSRVAIPDPLPPAPSISALKPSSGPIGQAVTVSGSNFGSSPGTVTFNGSPASVTNWSPTSFDTTVPAGATSGPVVVTVGGQASNGVTFTVLPGISSLNPTSGAVGQPVTITGTNFGGSQGGSTVTFNGVAAIVGSWGDTSIAVTVPALAATGPVVVTTSAGASNGQVFVVPTGVFHSYDALGRLVGTADPSGSAATFVYDAVGNLLSIQRSGSGTVSILSVSPSNGPTGTAVTISGTGYSAVPSQNTVLFNGTQATVVSSSATQLSVTVPAGATTGSVSVTAPAGAASGGPFTVTSISAATITNFTPAIAPAGTPVTINGTNFSTILADNRVQFNKTFAGLQTATSTALGTTVPATATSGRITVATPNGAVTSTDDFFVPPPPYGASDIFETHRMLIGESYTASVGTAGKIALVVFDATAGQRVSVRGTTGQFPSACDLQVTLLRPGVPVAPSCMGIDGFIDATTLPVASTYTLLVDPASALTGSVTLDVFNVFPDFMATLVPSSNPTAFTVPIASPGQNGVLTFAGAAAQRVALFGNGFSGQVAAYCDVLVTIRKPDTTQLTSPVCTEFGAYIDTVALPVAGTYSILVDPAVWGTGNVALWLYDVPADASGTITAGGPSVPLTLSAGQNALLTFSGAQQQRVSVYTLVTSGSFGCAWSATIRRVSDGAFVASVPSCGADDFIEPVQLPSTDTYSIKIDPAGSSAGSANVSLYTVVDQTGPIQVNGSAVGISLLTPGQRAALTFSGTQGQAVTASATVTSGAFGCAWSIALLKPDGSLLNNNVSCSSGNSVGYASLPTSGTYTVLVDPAWISTGAGNVTLTSP